MISVLMDFQRKNRFFLKKYILVKQVGNKILSTKTSLKRTVQFLVKNSYFTAGNVLNLLAFLWELTLAHFGLILIYTTMDPNI